MFGLLKNLFGKKDPQPQADTRSSQPAPSPGSPPAPAPKPSGQPHAQAKTTAFEPVPLPDGPHIKLALKPIIAKLPPSIASVQTQKLPANAECTVPLSKVTDQLAFGSVRISFAELYSWSTPKSLTFSAGQEEALIDLPLSEVLKHLGQDQLSRRPDQRQVEVPDEIENLFGPKGKPVRPVAPAPKSATPTPAPKPAPEPAPTQPKKDRTPEPFAPRTPPAPSTPPPAPAAKAAKVEPIAEKTVAAAAPQVAEAPSVPAHTSSVEPAPPATPEAPLKPSFSLPSPESLRPAAPAAPPAKPAVPTPKPPAPATPVPSLKTSPATTPSASTAPDGIKIPLASILAAATGLLKECCAGVEPGSFEVRLNSTEVENALKKGKFTLPGTTFTAQVTPPLPPAVAAKFGSEPVEIPLSVLVPVFMASRKPATNQRQVAVTESIPELFPTQKKPASTTSQPAQATIEQPKPAALQPATPAVATAKKPSTAEEIVGNLAAMKEVQGVVVTMDDGFVIASQVPVGFNIDFISAFVPAAYQRGVELLKALNFEHTEHVQLLHEGVQINMIPANTLYLLVFSNPGASISKAKLTEHAELLSKCATSN